MSIRGPRYNSKKDPSQRIIQNNIYNYTTDAFEFQPYQQVEEFYRPTIDSFMESDKLTFAYKDGQQRNGISRQPYTPIRIDLKYGKPTNTPNSAVGMVGYSFMNFGIDALPYNYTSTAVIGKSAVKALDRLIEMKQPFSLSVHFQG